VADGVEQGRQKQAGGVILGHGMLQGWGKVGGADERGAEGLALAQASAVRHEAGVVGAADGDDAGSDTGVAEQAVPGCMAAE